MAEKATQSKYVVQNMQSSLYMTQRLSFFSQMASGIDLKHIDAN